MFAIYKKEVKMFFTTMEASIAISVFFIANSLILWYIPSDANIFENNQASLLPFFSIAPFVLLILMPSITMKMISSEISQKTNLILFTKPIKRWEIISAKFLASLTIGVTSIIPSLIFIYTIYHISYPIGNIDQGELIGSYIGLMMLISLYSAIGLFCSSISNNTMIAMITTIIIILFLYLGIGTISIFEYFSIRAHYESISRGVIDLRDVIYFMSLTIAFLYFATISIEKNAANPIMSVIKSQISVKKLEK